jgi:hypothetical protein
MFVPRAGHLFSRGFVALPGGRRVVPRKGGETPKAATAGRTRDDLGSKAETVAERSTGSHDETKWALLTTEFWAMVALIVVILIATAISDSLNDVRAWTLVAIIDTG